MGKEGGEPKMKGGVYEVHQIATLWCIFSGIVFDREKR